MANKPNDSAGRTLRSIGALSAVGFSIVLAVLMGVALGYVVDRWLGTSPWGFLIGFVAGLVAAFRTALTTVASVSRDERE